jgi:toxin ParE1/3/4
MQLRLHREHDRSARAPRVALDAYESVEGLVEFPLRGRPGRKPDTRELVILGTLHCCLSRQGDHVEVLRVLHGAQKWP